MTTPEDAEDAKRLAEEIWAEEAKNAGTDDD